MNIKHYSKLFALICTLFISPLINATTHTVSASCGASCEKADLDGLCKTAIAASEWPDCTLTGKTTGGIISGEQRVSCNCTEKATQKVVK